MADFDPDKYLAEKGSAQPAFDPDAYLAQKGVAAPPAEPSMFDKIKSALPSMDTLKSKVDAASTGIGNGLMLGYGPQYEGVRGTLGDYLQGNVKPNESFGDRYVANRDAEVSREEKLKADSPYTYGAGELAGGLALPVPGSTELEAALAAKAGGGLLAKGAVKMGAGAAKGAALSGIANPGDTAGQVDPLQLDKRAGAAETGATIGGALAPVGMALEAAPEGVDSIKRWMTAQQLGANTGQLKRLLNEIPESLQRAPEEATRLDQLESFMNRNKMMGVGKNFSTTYDQSGDVMDLAGKKLGGVYSGVQDKINSDPDLKAKIADSALHGPDLAQEFLANEKARLNTAHGGAAALKTIEANIGNPDNPVGLTGLGADASLGDVHKYRVGVDSRINFDNPTDQLVGQSNMRLRQFLNDKLQSRIGAFDAASDDAQLPTLQQANRDYSDAKTINDITQQTKAREMAKMVGGLPGIIGGGAYGAYSHDRGDSLPESVLKGMGAALAIRGARAVGPGITYGAAKGLEPYLDKFAEPAAQKLPQVAPWLTMQKGNR